MSKNSELGQLYVAHCGLSELDLSKNPAIELVSCEHNKISKLNVSNSDILEHLNCSDNDLSELDLTSCKFLSQMINKYGLNYEGEYVSCEGEHQLFYEPIEADILWFSRFIGRVV